MLKGHLFLACPVALLGSASDPILPNRLSIDAPRLPPTIGHLHAVALALRFS